jgi:hypothetical protein
MYEEVKINSYPCCGEAGRSEWCSIGLDRGAEAQLTQGEVARWAA